MSDVGAEMGLFPGMISQWKSKGWGHNATLSECVGETMTGIAETKNYMAASFGSKIIVVRKVSAK